MGASLSLHHAADNPRWDDLVRRDENGNYLPIELPEWYVRETISGVADAMRTRAARLRQCNNTRAYIEAAGLEATADEADEYLADIGSAPPSLVLLRSGEQRV